MANISQLWCTLFWTCLFTLINAGGNCRGKTTCQSLRACAPVMTLIDSLQKPLSLSVVQFLRSQQCGFYDGYPKICCGVLPKTLHIFSKTHKLQNQRQQKKAEFERKEYETQLNLERAPSTTSISRHINKLSIYQPEAMDILNPPHFEITVSTAPPGASTVPYLTNLQKDEVYNPSDSSFLKSGEAFQEAMNDYMAHYDLQRTRRSGALHTDSDLDVEVR